MKQSTSLLVCPRLWAITKILKKHRRTMVKITNIWKISHIFAIFTIFSQYFPLFSTIFSFFFILERGTFTYNQKSGEGGGGTPFTSFWIRPELLLWPFEFHTLCLYKNKLNEVSFWTFYRTQGIYIDWIRIRPSGKNQNRARIRLSRNTPNKTNG